MTEIARRTGREVAPLHLEDDEIALTGRSREAVGMQVAQLHRDQRLLAKPGKPVLRGREWTVIAKVLPEPEAVPSAGRHPGWTIGILAAAAAATTGTALLVWAVASLLLALVPVLLVAAVVVGLLVMRRSGNRYTQVMYIDK